MNTELQRLISDMGIIDPMRCEPELAAQWVQAKALLFLAESAERIAAALPGVIDALEAIRDDTNNHRAF